MAAYDHEPCPERSSGNAVNGSSSKERLPELHLPDASPMTHVPNKPRPWGFFRRKSSVTQRRSPAASVSAPNASSAKLISDAVDSYTKMKFLSSRKRLPPDDDAPRQKLSKVKERASALEKDFSSKRAEDVNDEEPPLGDTSIAPQPEAKATTPEQLVNEVKGIYSGLVMVEKKCVEIVNQRSQAGSKLSYDQWQALIALHRTLLHEHHDFFLASQHPAASPPLKRLASKYAMPARMWRNGIHAFLELLRQQLPESHDHMLAFIYIAYGMMALLLESVESFKETWIECLGDLTRYRMAVEEVDIRDRDIWSSVARMWYNKAADLSPNVGRIQHHLTVLARPNIVMQLFYYSKALVSGVLFPNPRESVMLLFSPFLDKSTTVGTSQEDANDRHSDAGLIQYPHAGPALRLIGKPLDHTHALAHTIPIDARQADSSPSRGSVNLTQGDGWEQSVARVADPAADYDSICHDSTIRQQASQWVRAMISASFTFPVLVFKLSSPWRIALSQYASTAVRRRRSGKHPLLNLMVWTSLLTLARGLPMDPNASEGTDLAGHEPSGLIQDLLSVVFAWAPPITFASLLLAWVHQRARTNAVGSYAPAALISGVGSFILGDARTADQLRYPTLVTGLLLHIYYAKALFPDIFANFMLLATLVATTFFVNATLCQMSASSQGVDTRLFLSLLLPSGWLTLTTGYGLCHIIRRGRRLRVVIREEDNNLGDGDVELEARNEDLELGRDH